MKCASLIEEMFSFRYLATLYAHDDFPEEGPDQVNAEIRNNIQSSPFWLLRPDCLMRYRSVSTCALKSFF